jgi:hypothetical protein
MLLFFAIVSSLFISRLKTMMLDRFSRIGLTYPFRLPFPRYLAPRKQVPLSAPGATANNQAAVLTEALQAAYVTYGPKVGERGYGENSSRTFLNGRNSLCLSVPLSLSSPADRARPTAHAPPPPPTHPLTQPPNHPPARPPNRARLNATAQLLQQRSTLRSGRLTASSCSSRSCRGGKGRAAAAWTCTS